MKIYKVINNASVIPFELFGDGSYVFYNRVSTRMDWIFTEEDVVSRNREFIGEDMVWSIRLPKEILWSTQYDGLQIVTGFTVTSKWIYNETI